MKTKNLILTFALAALTTALSASEPTIGIQNRESYSEAELRMEPWMTEPFEYVNGEQDMVMESWMNAPFGNNVAEDDLTVESWMTEPFENVNAESDLLLEQWMTIPFNTDETIEIENWMAAAWK